MTRIQMRRGTAAQWTSVNPTLASGEHGFETDTGKEKIGTGSTAWVALPYLTDMVGAGTTAALAGKVDDNTLVINVKDYGAVGDNSTDNTAAITAAVTAAGSGGTVYFPKGIYRSGPLTTPIFTHLRGDTLQWGAGNPTTVLYFPGLTGTDVALTLGTNSSLTNLVLRGPGYSVGTVKGIAAGTLHTFNLSVLDFATGIHLTSAYYAQMRAAEFSRCGTGLKLSDAYNVNLYGPRFYCTTAAFRGIAIDGGGRGLNIFGGSIEAYSTGIKLYTAQTVNLSGVYFETPVSTNAIGVDANGLNQVTINVRDCFVYLMGHTYFVKAGSCSDLELVSTGNHFACAVDGVTAAVAYLVSSSQNVYLADDNFSEVLQTGISYVVPAIGAGITVAWPNKAAGRYGVGATIGVILEGRRRILYESEQTVATNTSVTFNCSYVVHAITLQANATSSGFSANVVPGQNITITWIQDAVGGHTYVWPAPCKFAGGVAPSDTTASTRTTVTFRYNDTVARYHETSRAVAVPVA